MEEVNFSAEYSIHIVTTNDDKYDGSELSALSIPSQYYSNNTLCVVVVDDVVVEWWLLHSQQLQKMFSLKLIGY